MGRRTAAKRQRRAARAAEADQSDKSPSESPSLGELKERLRKTINDYVQSGGRLTVQYMPTDELLRQRMAANEQIATTYIQTLSDQTNEQLPIISYSSHFNLPTITEEPTMTD